MPRVRGFVNEMYDLVLVDTGPLPPHERTWRHPSELGPTKHDVDTGPNSHVAVLAAGALAVLAVAAIVVAMTPRPSSGPTAISATTTPMRSVPLAVAPAVNARAATTAVAVRVSTGALLTPFSSYPHAIVAAPQPDLDTSGVAAEVPEDHDIVSLRTADVTYRLRWDLVPLMDVGDGSVVFDGSGKIVARIVGGEVLTLVGG